MATKSEGKGKVPDPKKDSGVVDHDATTKTDLPSVLVSESAVPRDGDEDDVLGVVHRATEDFFRDAADEGPSVRTDETVPYGQPLDRPAAALNVSHIENSEASATPPVTPQNKRPGFGRPSGSGDETREFLPLPSARVIPDVQDARKVRVRAPICVVYDVEVEGVCHRGESGRTLPVLNDDE